MSEEKTFGGMYDAKEINSNGSIIKVIGVGGGGGNAVKHMYVDGIVGVDFMICNTDLQVLENNQVPKKMMLGDTGLGAGAIPEVAKKLAEESKDKIKSFIGEDTKMLFITAGMGKGTGTGAAPVVAQVAHEMGILTIGVVTYPFQFEGSKRMNFAEEGIAEMKKYVDSLIVVNNDKILNIYPDESVEEAFGFADDVLKNAVKCIAELITVQAEQNIDFKDIETVMKNSGPAMLGLATASGPNRIKEVVDGALSCPLLDENMITNAKNFLFFISYGEDEPLKMSELAQIVKEFERVKSPNTDVIWGRAKDKNLGDKVKLSVIVTNYQTSEKITEVNVVSEIEKDDESGIHVSTEKQEGATFINVESSLQPEEPVTVMPAPVFEEEKEEIVSTPFTGDLFSGKMEEEPMPVTVAAVPTSETEHRKTIIRKGESVLSQLGMTKGIQYDDNESFDRIDNIPAIERANRLRAQNNETSRSSLFEQSDANNLYRQRAD